MSDEKNSAEALRWIETAEGDLDTARILRENSRFHHACFHAQQAGEKALKALWYRLDADPWGHSIIKLIEDLEELLPAAHSRMSTALAQARQLDRFYIPTRYPNGLPDITPDRAFSEDDATSAIAAADTILGLVKDQL